MATFLFAAMPASGHVNPLVTIARRLQGEGHVVVFVLPRGVDDMAERVAGLGFAVRQVAPPPGYVAFAVLPHLSGFVETTYALLLISGGLPHLARALGAVIDDTRPDAVVADFGFPAANLAAERAGLPHVTVYHAGLAYTGPGVPPFGSGLPIGGSWGARGRGYGLLSGLVHRYVHGAWRRARRRLRLPPAAPRHIWDSPWLTLLATTHEIEAPRHPYPTATFLVGPCFAGRHDGEHEAFPLERLATDRPVVYVSLGTVFNNKPRVFRRIFDAFSDGRCQLVVSAGGAWPAGVSVCGSVAAAASMRYYVNVTARALIAEFEAAGWTVIRITGAITSLARTARYSPFRCTARGTWARDLWQLLARRYGRSDERGVAPLSRALPRGRRRMGSLDPRHEQRRDRRIHRGRLACAGA